MCNFFIYTKDYLSKKYIIYIQNTKEVDLANVISLSEVDISGDDSERILLPKWDPSGTTASEYFCLAFTVDIGESVLRRMFPSDIDLLKIDLEIVKYRKKQLKDANQT